MEQTNTRDWAVAHLSGAIEDTIVLQYAEDLLDVCSGMERAGEELSEEEQEKREELEELVASIEERAKTYDPDLSTSLNGVFGYAKRGSGKERSQARWWMRMEARSRPTYVSSGACGS